MSRFARQSQGFRVKGSVQIVTSRHDQQPRTICDVNQQRVSHSFRDPSTSFPLSDHQCRQDKRTRDALFTRAPPNNKGHEFSNPPLPCLPCFCSVSKRETFHARTRQRAVRTHGCDIMRCDKCNNSVIICTCMCKCSVAWMVRHKHSP